MEKSSISFRGWWWCNAEQHAHGSPEISIKISSYSATFIALVKLHKNNLKRRSQSFSTLPSLQILNCFYLHIKTRPSAATPMPWFESIKTRDGSYNANIPSVPEMVPTMQISSVPWHWGYLCRSCPPSMPCTKACHSPNKRPVTCRSRPPSPPSLILLQQHFS